MRPPKIIAMVVCILLLSVPVSAGNNFREGGRDIGQGFRKLGLATGSAFKESGRSIGEAFKRVAKVTGHAFREAGKKTGEAFRGKSG